jgi:hypothetical protein
MIEFDRCAASIERIIGNRFKIPDLVKYGALVLFELIVCANSLLDQMQRSSLGLTE